MQNLRMIALHQFLRQHLFTALHQEISRYQSKRNHPLQDIDLHGKKEDVLYIGTWKKKIFFKGKFSIHLELTLIYPIPVCLGFLMISRISTSLQLPGR